MENDILLIALDMDGTLFDSTPLVGGCYRRTVAALELPVLPPTDEQLLACVGQPFKEIMRRVFPAATAEQQQQIANHALTLLVEEINNKKGIIFPGVTEVLSELVAQGKKLAIVSNGRPLYLDAILTTYDLKQYFGFVGSLMDVPAGGNKGDLLQLAIDQLGCRSVETIMVGDRESDFAAAQACGTRFIACSYGHGKPTEWPTADTVIDDFRKLPEKVL